jgi:hypothetical protein
MCWLQGVVGRLLDDMLSVFPREWIFTTEDKAAFGQGWPSQQQVWGAAGGAAEGGEGLEFAGGPGAERSPRFACLWLDPPLLLSMHVCPAPAPAPPLSRFRCCPPASDCCL